MRNVLVLLIALMSAAKAVEVDVALKNPATQKIHARIDSRATKIEQWKNSGAIGEASSGMLELLSNKKLSLLESKEIRDLIAAENGDRTALFREILHANHLEATKLEDIATAFARSRRIAATATQMVQSPKTKNWVMKKDFRE